MGIASSSSGLWQSGGLLLQSGAMNDSGCCRWRYAATDRQHCWAHRLRMINIASVIARRQPVRRRNDHHVLPPQAPRFILDDTIACDARLDLIVIGEASRLHALYRWLRPPHVAGYFCLKDL